METASTDVTSIWRGESTWRTHRYFIDFESRIHAIISMSNRCHNFPADSFFKIDVISTNFPHRTSTSNRWRINENVSIGIFLVSSPPSLTTIRFPHSSSMNTNLWNSLSFQCHLYQCNLFFSSTTKFFSEEFFFFNKSMIFWK